MHPQGPVDDAIAVFVANSFGRAAFVRSGRPSSPMLREASSNMSPATGQFGLHIGQHPLQFVDIRERPPEQPTFETCDAQAKTGEVAAFCWAGFPCRITAVRAPMFPLTTMRAVSVHTVAIASTIGTTCASDKPRPPRLGATLIPRRPAPTGSPILS